MRLILSNDLWENIDYFKIFGSEAQLLEISERVEWDFCMGESTIIYDYIGEYTTLKKDILNTL